MYIVFFSALKITINRRYPIGGLSTLHNVASSFECGIEVAQLDVSNRQVVLRGSHEPGHVNARRCEGAALVVGGDDLMALSLLLLA